MKQLLHHFSLILVASFLHGGLARRAHVNIEMDGEIEMDIHTLDPDGTLARHKELRTVASSAANIRTSASSAASTKTNTHVHNISHSNTHAHSWAHTHSDSHHRANANTQTHSWTRDANAHTQTRFEEKHQPATKAEKVQKLLADLRLLKDEEESRARDFKLNKGSVASMASMKKTSLVSQADLNLHQTYKKLQKSCACKNGVETSTDVCFASANSFRTKYSAYGRTLHLEREKLSLDFEVETDANMELTPELVLARGGFDVAPDKMSSPEDLPQPSKWFSVQFDGMGHRFNKTDYQQQISVVLELESVPMKLADVKGSSFLQDMERFVSAMGNAEKTRLRVPGSKQLFYQHFKKGKPASLQFTVGLPLAWVPSLLSKSSSLRWQSVEKRMNNLRHCRPHEASCTLEYRALVSLAAGTLRQAKSCATCKNPKRCMVPWLVRTHFGDLLNHVRQSLGNHTLDKFPEDVLQVAAINPDDPIFPNGIMDYLQFPELAEVGGLVVPRSSTLVFSQNHTNASLSQLRCMPTTGADVFNLAKSMVEQTAQVNERLRHRACAVHGLEDEGLAKLSARTWLQEMLQGRDLMADSDSPVTQKSYSKLVWKSMGSWRMSPEGGDRVYLECKDPKFCFKTLSNKTQNETAVTQIREIVDIMQTFEHTMAATLV